MTASPSEPGQVDLTILITCYNEEDLIVDTLRTVTGALAQTQLSYDIVVIDDCSKDGSVARIRKFLEENPSYPITLKVNEVNHGFASNYVDGAFLGRGRHYHLVSGDNAFPADSLLAAYRLLDKADMVIPYQYQNEVTGKTLARRAISRVFTWTVNFLSGYRIRYYNGMSLQLRYNVMRWHPISYGFGFQADLLTMLLDQGLSYVQVYSRSVDNKGRKSTSLTMRNFLSVCHTLLEIAIRRLRRMLYGKRWPKPVEIKVPDSPEGK
jgi:glycosyltransferase involved in cell wall biosynthesis